MRKGKQFEYFWAENSKTYKLYNLNTEKIIISIDVYFVEEKAFKYIIDVGKFISIDLINVNNENVRSSSLTKKFSSPSILDGSSISSSISVLITSKRIKRHSGWMKDYINLYDQRRNQ